MEEFKVKVTKKPKVTEVEMVGQMTIDRVRELKTALMTAFARGKDISLVLERVTELDLSGLQVLCSAHRLSLSQKIGLSVSGRDKETVAAAALAAGLLRSTGCKQDVDRTCLWTNWNQCCQG